MNGIQRFGERMLQAIGVNFVFLNQHASAAIDRNKQYSLIVRYHGPKEPEKGLMKPPAWLQKAADADVQQKQNDAGAQFMHGMRTLAERLRKENRLSGITEVVPDVQYPNPYFSEPLSARDFYNRFGTGQAERTE